jgi:hypothetical protein
MKCVFIVVLSIGIYSCNPTSNQVQVLQNRIDSLERKLTDTYKPGFGEFMSSIQTHHAKLWFAGINENWKLADFELHEILETIENIQKYETERKESEMIGMIIPALDSVNNAIRLNNSTLFKNSYNILTTTCNSCHHSTNFEFNVVKTPDIQPFSNQEFSIKIEHEILKR